MISKPYSQACENNKRPILQVIQQYFSTGRILEIGSGSGQHASYFADHLPDVYWQPTDQKQYLEGIHLWVEDYPKDNLADPLELDVTTVPWPVDAADGVFSANTAHIMHWPEVECMFQGVASILKTTGYFCLYGPVNINYEFTSDSNKGFDQMLRNKDPAMGIRHLEDLQSLAQGLGLQFVSLHQMPANNVIMVWQQTAN